MSHWSFCLWGFTVSTFIYLLSVCYSESDFFVKQALVAVLLMIVKTGTFLPLPANFTISTDLVVTVAVYLLWHLIVCSSASLHSKTMCGLNMVSAVCHIGISIMLMVIVASLKTVLGMKSTSSKEVGLTMKESWWIFQLVLAAIFEHERIFRNPW